MIESRHTATEGALYLPCCATRAVRSIPGWTECEFAIHMYFHRIKWRQKRPTTWAAYGRIRMYLYGHKRFYVAISGNAREIITMGI